MTETPDIDALRKLLRDGVTLHERISAFVALSTHQKTTWRDLVDALSCPDWIKEQAMFQLYERSGRPIGTDGPCSEPDFWITTLTRDGFLLDDTCPKNSDVTTHRRAGKEITD